MNAKKKINSLIFGTIHGLLFLGINSKWISFMHLINISHLLVTHYYFHPQSVVGAV